MKGWTKELTNETDEQIYESSRRNYANAATHTLIAVRDMNAGTCVREKWIPREVAIELLAERGWTE
jgi:hypothetical protein